MNHPMQEKPLGVANPLSPPISRTQRRGTRKSLVRLRVPLLCSKPVSAPLRQTVPHAPKAAMNHRTPKRRTAVLCGLAVLLLSASSAMAVERFPPPDFTDHKIPVTATPPSRAELYEYLDLAALTVGLSLATYLAIVRRSRRGLFLLTIISLAWLGFWRGGCICPIGSIQNVALAIFDPGYALPWTVAVVFALPILVALFFGRTFCAAVCPLGAMQELVALRPVNVPVWLDQALGLLSYIYLGLGVLFASTGAAFVICRYDPFVGFFRRSASLNMLVIGACFLVVGIFVGRPYCRYFCPYGAILAVVSKLSKWHAKIPPDDCIQCRLCEEACPYGAIREPTILQPAPERGRGRRRLAALLVALPVLIAMGYWLGRQLETPLAQVHPTVRLAERIRLEQTGMVADTTDASDAFRTTGRTADDLYQEAASLSGRFRLAGGLFGAWVGLVIGYKLIYLSIRRKRIDYQPDRAACVSCGRCFEYCPTNVAGTNVAGTLRVPSACEKVAGTGQHACMVGVPSACDGSKRP
jgi:NosR/NirI family transcriptional regulator, nitrous oxide reductase regulator